MGPEVINGFLWLARTSLRCGRMPVRAGHGYADSAYRPADLPYVSALGPMWFDVEPERDEKGRHVLVLMPGHVLGARRESPGVVIAPGGALKLRFDGDSTVTLSGLPGVDLGDDQSCLDFAVTVEQGLSLAAQNGGYTGPDGKVVASTARLAELAQGKVRWDPETRRFAITSGRQGIAWSVRASSVEVLPVAGSVSTALGLDGGTSVPGRMVRHKLPPPRAITLDVRLDLWAATQPEMASLSDALCRLVPSRGAVRTLPALLAADAEAGTDTLVLLAKGEPTLPVSLLHVEAAAGAVDRVTGRALSPGIAPQPDGTLLLDATTPSSGLRVLPTPLVPGPFDAPHPLPRGLALTLGVKVAGGGVDGQTLSLCALTFGGDPVLAITAALVTTNGSISADLTAVATFVQADGTAAQASSTLRLPLSQLEEGVALHAAVVAATGTIEWYADGAPQMLDDPKSTPVLPTVVQGVPSAGTGMMFVLGDAGGNPLDLRVSHAHLFAEPIGPFDPDLRRSVSVASRFPPGKRIRIALAGEKISTETRATLNVVSVSGDTLRVFPELPATFAKGRSVVFAEEHFFQQTALRRKDDLANHLYRLTAEYRVSALLEPDFVLAPATAVEAAIVEVIATGPSGGEAALGPGTDATVV